MGRPSQVIVLAEDERHRRFVRRYLERLNFPLHSIRPDARGGGEHWVRANYVEAVRSYRKRSARAESALVVSIDADNRDVNRRIGQFDEALAAAGLQSRTATEKIVHLIPKWSIETWILALSGRIVNEDTSYRDEHGIDDLIRSAAAALFEWSRPNARIGDSCPPSLISAIDELKRLG